MRRVEHGLTYRSVRRWSALALPLACPGLAQPGGISPGLACPGQPGLPALAWPGLAEYATGGYVLMAVVARRQKTGRQRNAQLNVIKKNREIPKLFNFIELHIALPPCLLPPGHACHRNVPASGIFRKAGPGQRPSGQPQPQPLASHRPSSASQQEASQPASQAGSQPTAGQPASQ